MPARIFPRVLFPAPFSPQSAWHDPAATSSVTSLRATTPGKDFEIPSNRTAVVLAMAGSVRHAADQRLIHRGFERVVNPIVHVGRHLKHEDPDQSLIRIHPLAGAVGPAPAERPDRALQIGREHV